jgi:hypothetical protein
MTVAPQALAVFATSRCFDFRPPVVREFRLASTRRHRLNKAKETRTAEKDCGALDNRPQRTTLASRMIETVGRTKRLRGNMMVTVKVSGAEAVGAGGHLTVTFA